MPGGLITVRRMTESLGGHLTFTAIEGQIVRRALKTVREARVEMTC